MNAEFHDLYSEEPLPLMCGTLSNYAEDYFINHSHHVFCNIRDPSVRYRFHGGILMRNTREPDGQFHPGLWVYVVNVTATALAATYWTIDEETGERI